VHDYQIQSRDPQEVARHYAALYEPDHPELRLPYYQGCLNGLRRRARYDKRRKAQQRKKASATGRAQAAE
jgi:hypothetical protein